MGTAGAGKTSLALHGPTRSRQLPRRPARGESARLDPTGVPATADEVIHGFLDALQIRPEARPRGLEAQAALYRSLLADRRFLIVLDNARDADQVRPLLPGRRAAWSCDESRQLDGLIAAGAEPVVLDRLSTDGARQLLIGRLGAERVAREPEAADEIAALCSGAAAGVDLAAARASDSSRLALSAIAAGLRDAGTRLGELSGGDSLTDVRAVFSWSYRHAHTRGSAPLPPARRPPRARYQRSAARRPARRVAAEEALPVLRDLLRAHLVEETSPGRFGFHDLLRAYAVELAVAEPGSSGLRPGHRPAISSPPCCESD